MDLNGRKSDGKFAKGYKGGPGRPPRATEVQYLATLRESVSLKDWREVVGRALEDAKNGDAKARDWLAGYLVGKPRETVESEAEPLEAPKVVLLDWRPNAAATSESN